MPHPTAPIPPPEDLLALFRGAAANAQSLLADAQCLMDSDCGSVSRAHALATFAAEELGKSKLCLVALAAPWSASAEPKEFWAEFYSHRKKLLRELGVQGLLLQEQVLGAQDVVGRLPGESHAIHQRKVLGLFVDYENGVIRLPSEISASEAQRLIDDVRVSLNVIKVVLAQDDAMHQLRDLSSSGQEDFLRHALNVLAPDCSSVGDDAASLFDQIQQRVAADPDAAVAAWHEIWAAFRPQ